MYGGTKTEMERLIADANEYAKANGMAADLTIDSFSDIVTAIDLIQQKQGVAGTTAREAATTVSGSIGMLKAAWDNLITGMADKDADLQQLINNVLESAKSVVKNMMPVIEQSLTGITQFLGEGIPMILSEFAPMINELLPEVMKAATQLFVGIIQALPSLMNSLFASILSIGKTFMSELPKLVNGDLSTSFRQIIASIKTYAPQFLEGAISLMQEIGTAVAENLPSILEEVLPQILSLSEGIREGAGQFVDAGIDLILNLMQGLMDALPTIIEYLPQIITNILGVINDNAPKLLMGGVQLIIMLVQGIIQSIPAIIDNFGHIVEMIISIISAVNWVALGGQIITFLVNGVKSLASTLPSTFSNLFKDIVNFIRGIDWIGLGRSIIQFLGSGIGGMAKTLLNLFVKVLGTLVVGFHQIDWVSLGKNIIKGIIQGIKALGGQIKEILLGLMSDAVSGVKKFFGIHSPSRKMRDEVGKRIPEGMALGIHDNADMVAKEMESLERIPKVDPDDWDFGGDYPSGNRGGANGGVGATTNNYTINVNQPVKSVSEMAREIRTESQYGLIVEGEPV